MSIYTYVFLKEEVLKSKDFKLNTTTPSLKGEICGVKVSKKDYGELYFMADGFDSKIPDDVKQYVGRTETTCSFTPDQGRREKGVYRSGKVIAELDRSIMHKDWDYILRLKGQGYCLKEMEALYHEIRAGNIKPSSHDSYEKEQCKENPRLASTMIRQINKILFKGFFFPLGFWREVKNIVRKAESEMTA